MKKIISSIMLKKQKPLLKKLQKKTKLLKLHYIKYLWMKIVQGIKRNYI